MHNPHDYHPTPADIHHYDQTIAAMTATLDTFVDAYKKANQKFGDEQTTMGLMSIIVNRAENAEAVAQFLALACRRIAQLETGIQQIKNAAEQP